MIPIYNKCEVCNTFFDVTRKKRSMYCSKKCRDTIYRHAKDNYLFAPHADKLPIIVPALLNYDGPGIYLIRSNITNKVYIGSSANVKRRILTHIRLINKCKHTNHLINKDTAEFGPTQFVFSLLETCNIKDLKAKEREYIRKSGVYAGVYNVLEL